MKPPFIQTLFLVSLGILFFTSPCPAGDDIIRIKPSEIFEGLPPTIPTATLVPPKSPVPTPTPAPSPSPSPPPVDTGTSQSLSLPPELLQEPAPSSTTLAIHTTPVPVSPTPTFVQEKPEKVIVFDNKLLKEFVKAHPSPEEPLPVSDTPTPLPDIGELRARMLASPTPFPRGDVFVYQLSIKEHRSASFNRVSPPEAVIDYQMRTFYGRIVLESRELGETYRFLKNAPSRETISVLPGTYRIAGEFWRFMRPEERIKTSLGDVPFKDNMTYVISLDRNLEQALLYELELRNLEKKKKEAGKRRGFSE